MSLILSAVTTYGRLIMMSAEGAVVQMGATQTVIVQHTGLYGTVACIMQMMSLIHIALRLLYVCIYNTEE